MVSNFSNAQNSFIYSGDNSTNILSIIDTIGGLNLVTTKTLTSNFDVVQGTFGLSVDPDNGDMYILYQTDVGGAEGRRLGILDTVTAAVTDIGEAGNLTDISFSYSDSVLYGTTGYYSNAFSFVSLDKATGTSSVLFSYGVQKYGPSIGYNSFNSTMYHTDRDSLRTIDLINNTETYLTPTNHPGETHSILFISDSIAWVANYDEIYELNTNTNVFSLLTDTSNVNFHALAFGAPNCIAPPLVLAGTDTTVCVNEMFTLSGSGTANSYTWDNGVVDGVGFLPTLGTTQYIVSGIESACSSVDTINITANEAAAFTLAGQDEISGSDGSIQLTITSGTAPFVFDWDNDGTGDFDDTQDLSGLVAGTYTVIIEDSLGCASTDAYVVDSQLSISDESITNISIYPNPIVTNVNIELEGDFTYSVIALNGEVLLNGIAKDNTKISMETMASGIYFVEVRNENNSYSTKVVKK
jgi:hypothetical protein